MKKYVFGLGSAQVLATAFSAGLFAHFVSGVSGPAAIVIGNGLALSSTAVVLQVPLILNLENLNLVSQRSVTGLNYIVN
jgi:Kef-type K+ transport system membrane component KefB